MDGTRLQMVLKIIAKTLINNKLGEIPGNTSPAGAQFRFNLNSVQKQFRGGSGSVRGLVLITPFGIRFKTRVQHIFVAAGPYGPLTD